MPFMTRDGLDFHYLDEGQGLPFVFQHGLGGDVQQPRGLYAPQPGVRFVSLDCRGHGETRPLGSADRLTFDSLADDVLALMAELGLEAAVVGGISMGAGIALNLALRYPERVRGLILSRPAWLDQPLPANVQPIAEVGRLIREHGAQQGLAIFRTSELYSTILRESSDVAASLIGQFEHPRAEETAVKLERLAGDAPNRNRAEWSQIQVPTLILFNQLDPIHPAHYAETLVAHLPHAEVREVTAKSISVDRYTQDTQRFVTEFLSRFLKA